MAKPNSIRSYLFALASPKGVQLNRNPRTSHRQHSYYSLGVCPSRFSATDAEIQNLNKYADLVSDYLTEKAASLQADVETRIQVLGLDKENASHFYEAFEEQFDEWCFSFPSLVRSSVVTSACSLLEASLTDVCKHLDREFVSTISKRWPDFKDAGVRRAACHLRQNFQIHLEDHKTWEHLLHHYHVRNAIVHAGGNLLLLSPEKRTALDSALLGLKFPGLDEKDDKLRIPPPYPKKVIDDIASLWTALQGAFIDNSHIGPKYWP